MNIPNKIDIEDAIQCQLNNMKKLIKHDSFEYSYNPHIGCIEICIKKSQDDECPIPNFT